MTDGEAWTRELLAELQVACFRPRAWTRFLRRSFERAAERRAERPREHRTVQLLALAGVAGWMIAGPAALGWTAAAGAGWWLAVCLMLDWHLGMLERPDGRALGRLGPANVLSLLRAGVVPVLLLVPAPVGGALLLAAGVSDAIDGPLARRRDEVTRLGLWLDGTVDTFVLAAAALAAPVPGWAVALVLVRCGLPWLAVAGCYFGRGQAPGRERAVSGRYPGLVLFAGLVLALFDVGGAAWVASAGAAAGLGTFALTVVRQRASKREELRGRLLDGHAPGRVGVDRLREPAGEGSRLDRERTLVDQLAGVGADDLRADQLAAAEAAE